MSFPKMEYKEAKVEIGEVQSSLELFQKIYRNPDLPLHTRMRAAIAAKDHEHPKLIATAIVNEGSFAALLDKAIQRSNGAKVINHEGSPSNGLSENPLQSEAQAVSAEHQRRPILSRLTRRV